MSETETVNPTNPTEENSQPEKKKSKLFLIIGLLVVLVAGGAGGFYFWSKSKAEAAEAETETEEPKAESKTKKSKTKKVSEDDEEESEKSGSLSSALPNDEEVKHVVEIPPFIVNLVDTDSPRYLRMSVSLGIGGEEGKAEKPDPLFLTRVKNAMLAVLTTKKSEDVLTVEGKAKLRKELLKAAQAASEEPHVEAIYITDFIVQL